MISLLVIQSTPFCNISCDYCYLPDRQSRRALSLDTVDHIFRRLFKTQLLGPQLGVVWHAGEPLVTPISFYDAAFRRIDSFNITNCIISHSIQTNGILITQEWCDFIKTRDIRVGVSIDGPAFIHDAHRKTRAGKGTHAKVMQGISLLRQNSVSFHVIAVLSQQSLDFPDEIFNFFVENEIFQIGFNIEEIEGVNKASSLDQAGTDEQYRKFMRRIYFLAKESKGAVRIREFEWARNIICQEPPSMAPGSDTVILNHQVVPFGIISVDCDGNFSTFSPELLGQKSSSYGHFIFGNVQTDGFDSVFRNERFLSVHQDIAAGVDLCRTTCEYFELCGGGAPANKYFEHGSFRWSETMFCRYTVQTPIDIVLSDIESCLLHGETGSKLQSVSF